MKNQFDQFNALHHDKEPLILPNAWNVQSAMILEQQGFKAIATSSASVADAFGYNDGEEMTFGEYLFVIERIAKKITLPLSVDLEAGYGDSAEAISDNIRILSELGVSGVNLEDSVVTNGKRSIFDATVFATRIREVIDILYKKGIKIFINLRTDPFLLGLPDALEDTVARIAIYQGTGAHGLFVPCITAIDDIRKVCAKSSLPVNVMCMPGLPGFDELESASVKRISMGPFLSKNIYKKLEEISGEVIRARNFDSVFK